MKWLSVKKFVLPSSTSVFIRIVSYDSEGDVYDRYVVGSVGNFSFIENWEYWDIEGDHYWLGVYPHVKVTHFAIPDAVEIEAD